MAQTFQGQIDEAYINSYREGFMHAFQQKDSRFRPYVLEKPQKSEYEYHDRIGVADRMNKVTSRYGDSPLNEVPHDRRRTELENFDWGKIIDEDVDVIRVLTDPSTAYTQSAVYAANREIDYICRDGVFADVRTGKEGDTTIKFVPANDDADAISIGEEALVDKEYTPDESLVVTKSNSSPSFYEGIDIGSQFVREGSAAESNITLDKLRAARYVLQAMEVIDQGEVLDCWLSANQFEALLRIKEVYHGDTAVRKRLEEGAVTSFMGYRFIHYEGLSKTGNYRHCIIAKQKTALQLAIGIDKTIQVFPRPDKKNLPYIYIKMAMGMTRMWGDAVARLNCDETVL